MLWPEVQHIVSQTIDQYHLLEREEQVLVAISGGPDSVLLAYTLQQLGYPIGLAHLNYQLREADSEADEQLVRQYSQEWQVPLYIQRCAPKAYAKEHKMSLQEAARHQRYAFFAQLMEQEGYPKCATGHQADDQVETLLMSLIRGNSPSILKGIPAQREQYIRPLLGLSREQVLACLDELGLRYATDASNAQNDYLRNQFRNQLLPLLRELNPSVQPQILQRYQWYQQQHLLQQRVLADFLDHCVERQHGEQYLNWAVFRSQMGDELLPLLVIAFGERLDWHGQSLWRLLELIPAQKGKWIDFGEERITRTEDGLRHQISREAPSLRTITLASLPKLANFPFGDRKIHLRQPSPAPHAFGEAGTLYLNIQSLELPLVIRPWQEGDRIKAFGMKGSKKLSDVFVDEKYTAFQKQQAIVFADQKGIVALSDYRIAERCRIPSEADKVLKIVIEDPK
ncbi:MAG: tRNA lysidine(34) synthetase TilS [Bacteroidota bacterium]